jgi:integrase
MFSQAIEWEHCTKNPVKRIKFKKENNSRTRFLEKEELQELLKYCHPLLQSIVLVAVNTGMRREEIWGEPLRLDRKK